MRGRIIISALLVLVLLSLSSFGAICKLDCRSAVMPKPMAMSSMERTSAYTVAVISHHQHHHSKVRQVPLNSETIIAAEMPQETVASQACCSSNQTVSSCVARNQNVLQEPTTGPKVDVNSAIVRTHAFATLPIIKSLGQTFAPRTSVRHETPSSLTLRI